MNIEKLKEQLIIDEGMVLKIYLDHLGNPTFGVGHLLTKNDPEHKPYWKGEPVSISLGRAEDALKQDIENCLKDCRKLFKNYSKFLEEIQQILANMMFNLGYVRLSKFKKFIKAIEDNNYKIAAKEMQASDWYNQVGDRAKRLVARMDKIANDSLCNV